MGLTGVPMRVDLRAIAGSGDSLGGPCSSFRRIVLQETHLCKPLLTSPFQLHPVSLRCSHPPRLLRGWDIWTRI